MSEREPEPDCWWVDALDDEAQARAGGWSSARLWHWIDAAAWCAAQNPDVMALLTGYRDFRDRAHPEPVGEGACRIVALMHIAEPDIAKAERQLRAWCRAGVLEAISISTGAALTGVDWEAGREPVSSDMPLVMLPAAGVRDLSPAPLASTSPAVDAPSAPNKPDAEQCLALAAAFDAEGISKRAVSSLLIKERWAIEYGPPPTVDSIKSDMKGQPKGRTKK